MRFSHGGFGLLVSTMLLPICIGGCPDLEDIIDELDLDDIELRINSNINQLQTSDPRFVDLPPALDSRGDTIIINNNVTIINNILNLLNVETYWQWVVTGLIVIVAVACCGRFKM